MWSNRVVFMPFFDTKIEVVTMVNIRARFFFQHCGPKVCSSRWRASYPLPIHDYLHIRISQESTQAYLHIPTKQDSHLKFLGFLKWQEHRKMLIVPALLRVILYCWHVQCTPPLSCQTETWPWSQSQEQQYTCRSYCSLTVLLLPLLLLSDLALELGGDLTPSTGRTRCAGGGSRTACGRRSHIRSCCPTSYSEILVVVMSWGLGAPQVHNWDLYISTINSLTGWD